MGLTKQVGSQKNKNCSYWFTFSSLYKTNIYQNLGDFTRIGDITSEVPDCE